jgi:2-Cys peroxiredoxin 5
VRDISERGARLRVADPDAVPIQFELMFKDSRERRPARVRWRSGREIGVAFVPRATGEKIPSIKVGSYEAGQLTSIDVSELLGAGRSVVLGVVGAFAPQRMLDHLTEMLARAPDLHRLGFSRIVCAVPNDPWVVRAWSNVVDPDHRITFVADANLELATWLGATFLTEPHLQLGVRSQGYLALVNRGIIERFSTEEIEASLVAQKREPTLSSAHRSVASSSPPTLVES